jgi:hypothetical protein
VVEVVLLPELPLMVVQVLVVMVSGTRIVLLGRLGVLTLVPVEVEVDTSIQVLLQVVLAVRVVLVL